MRNTTIYLTSVAALVAAACGQSGPSASDLNSDLTGGTSSSVSGSGGSDSTGGTGTPTGGSVSTGGADPSGGASGSVATGGAGPSGGTGGTGGAGLTGGIGASAGSGGTDMPPTGGTGGDGMATGGAAGSGMTGGAGGAGGAGGQPPRGPYDPRSGTFKMLVYSRTVAFRHTDSIGTGRTMLQQIATEQGFTITATETNTDITAAGLAQYEVVFFMNPTGDIFNPTEQRVFEEWMTTKNGGFAGVHSATDTENGWAFYSEVTGQYYDLHELCCAQASIQWDPAPAAQNHVAVRGLPSPWQRSEEWYNFNRQAEWSAKPGFQILSRVTVANVARPVSYTREWGNFRAFYTSLGHQGSTFQDANVKKHVAAGIMWAARREALLVQ